MSPQAARMSAALPNGTPPMGVPSLHGHLIVFVVHLLVQGKYTQVCYIKECFDFRRE